MTLLEMTQDILSDMDSDEVNDINDSVEALQVAQIIKTTFFSIVDGKHYPHFDELFQLEAATAAKPTHMKIPERIENIDWIKYNTKKTSTDKDLYTKIKYLSPQDFVNKLDGRDSTDSKVEVVTTSSGIPINIHNDRAPEFFTSFDEEYIVFDAYNKLVDDHLQATKSQAYGKRHALFEMKNNFVADLPVNMFSYFLAEAKSTSFLTLKQMANQKAEQVSVRQRRIMSQEAWKVNDGIEYPNYGRKQGRKNPRW
jgi:hypothetical protein